LDENKNWLKQKHDQLLWINNELVYFNEPLKNVIKSAHRNFGDSIVIDKSLEDVKITITFKGKTKEQVIYTLGELANAKVKFNKQKNVWEMRTKYNTFHKIARLARQVWPQFLDIKGLRNFLISDN